MITEIAAWDSTETEAFSVAGNLHYRTQTAEPTHIYLLVHRMHYRAGAQEQLGFEESMYEQVEDS